MSAYRGEVFGFRFDPRYRLLARVFGINPSSTGVWLTGDELLVRYGPWTLRTARSNVAGTAITGPYHVLTTIGPLHLSLTDRGLSCATNPDEGLCITFDEPVPGIEPLGVLRHPGVTVTVAGCREPARALS